MILILIFNKSILYLPRSHLLNMQIIQLIHFRFWSLIIGLMFCKFLKSWIYSACIIFMSNTHTTKIMQSKFPTWYLYFFPHFIVLLKNKLIFFRELCLKYIITLNRKLFKNSIPNYYDITWKRQQRNMIEEYLSAAAKIKVLRSKPKYSKVLQYSFLSCIIIKSPPKMTPSTPAT